MSEVHKRTGVCDVCESGCSKYCCPGCDIRSCSLECVKNHKGKSGCSGVRSRTKYVPLSSFNDGQLLSDYHFLEDVGRMVDSSQRTRKYSSQNQADSWKRTQHLRWLCRHAVERGIKLKLLSAGMTRHTINTSKSIQKKCKKNEWLVHWRVHLLFTHTNTLYQEKSVSELTSLRTLLDRYIHPSNSDPLARHKLAMYVQSWGEDGGVEVWLEGTSGTAEQQLNVDATLKENFVNCTITEFPTLHVFKKGSAPCVPLQAQTQGRLEEVKCSVEVRSEAGGKCEVEEGEVVEEGEMCADVCQSLHLIAQSYGQSDSDDAD